jgi:uncharacterized damage-inducible protein DinB
MRTLIQSVAGEYERYKSLGEGALAQVADADLSRTMAGQDNSAAAIAWHIAGNLESRFTDFLTSDGEKPWRDRESEFASRTVSRAELMEKWARGWAVLLGTLAALQDEQLDTTVTIRGQPLRVSEALHRSLSHTSYHVGQIVYLAKSFAGPAWKYLSIAPGKSGAYNAAPDREKPPRAVAPEAAAIADRLLRMAQGSMWHGPTLRDLRAGLTPAEASARPVGAAHTIAEILRHMVTWADFARLRLRPPERPSITAAEDWPPAEARTDADLAALWAAVDEAYAALAAEVKTLGVEELHASAAGKTFTVADMAQGVVEHGAYHAGQIALLLRAQRGPAT